MAVSARFEFSLVFFFVIFVRFEFHLFIDSDGSFTLEKLFDLISTHL